MLVIALFLVGCNGATKYMLCWPSESVAVAEDGSLYLPDCYGSILRATLTGINCLPPSQLVSSHCAQIRGPLRPHRLLQAVHCRCIAFRVTLAL